MSAGANRKPLLDFLQFGTGNACLAGIGIIFNHLLQKQLGADLIPQFLKGYPLL